MDCRNYYINLKPEDFKFVKPETKKTSQKGKVYDDEVRENEEKEEEEEIHYYFAEYYHDYNDDGVSEVQSERRDSEAYKPLESEIDEWLQAVHALSSSRAVVRSGRLFGDLDPVPFIDEVDPAPGACFNCWQAGHPSRVCLEPRTAFCINCGRRGESVVDCPRCSRHQFHFFARRREEERRRAESLCREAATRTTSRERPAGRSRSVGRQITKASGVPEGISDWRAEVTGGARSRREAVSLDRRGGPQSEIGVAEKPIDAAARMEGNDYRGRDKGPEEVPASARPRRRRRRTRRRTRGRDTRENMQGANPAQQEQNDGERRRNYCYAKEPADNSLAAARRERPIGAAVECRQEGVAARTEMRRVEERQQTAEDHVTQEEQRAALYWAEESWRECENRFFEEEKPNELGIKPKKRSEEQKIPINLDDDKHLNLFERMNRQLSVQFCKLMEAMQLSRPEVDRILALLKEIQHYDTLKQELIILDELMLLESGGKLQEIN